MRHGNRRSNIANHQQNGTWLTRFRKDGVFPIGKRKVKKEAPKVNRNQINDVIPSDQIISFCNHNECLRLSIAIPKIQLEGLFLFINKARKKDYRAIMISFLLLESTRNY